jgi:ribosome-binding factor A
MAREFYRSQRVGEQILRVLSDLIRRELKDPRVAGVSFTAVDVSRDLSHATAFFSMLDPDAESDAAERALTAARGLIRSQLGKEMRIRRVPELHFAHDDSIAEGARLTRLIDDAVATERKGQRDD